MVTVRRVIPVGLDGLQRAHERKPLWSGLFGCGRTQIDGAFGRGAGICGERV